MKTSDTNIDIYYRVSFALIDQYGVRDGVELPSVMHLTFTQELPPLLPKVGERINLMADLVDYSARTYRVVDIEHGISLELGSISGHQIVIVPREV